MGDIWSDGPAIRAEVRKVRGKRGGGGVRSVPKHARSIYPITTQDQQRLRKVSDAADKKECVS